MKTLLLSLLVISFNCFAVDGLTIPNSHQVDKDGQLFRGREPGKLVSELKDIGITDVIILKNDTKGEVEKELTALKKLNIKSHHIPFRWKDLVSNQQACEQLVEAINIIQAVKKNNGSVFFHCTAGEDRTGMLAGLYRMLEENISSQMAFKTEMCAHGYSDGNPVKPGMVTGAIQKELTPLFIALSGRIENKEWVIGQLTKKSCKNLKVEPTKLKCKVKN